MLETNILTRFDSVTLNTVTKNVPNVTFKTRQHHEWADVTTADLFKGKNVIASSLPGAFTLTCSSTHVLR